MQVHDDLDSCLTALGSPRLFALSTRGTLRHDRAGFRAGDALLFGREDAGLPDALLMSLPESQRLRLPMRAGNRSLNLSNAVAITVFEAWRQMDFEGAS